jgi:hypothetical protein
MPSRIISYLCLFQVLGLMGAYLFAGWLLKNHEKLNGSWVLSTPCGERMAAVRFWILPLILIPVGTVAFSMYLAKSHRDIIWLRKAGFWVAIVITGAVLCFSAVTMMAAVGGPPRRTPARFLSL